jgi:peptidoglycan/xylan/chitin deacetylase (PgdA/CDA1 family)
MYHSVKAEDVPGFSRQMDMLKKSTHIVRAGFSETDALPGGCYVALTFDDGFESFERYVLPVLRERHIPATVFVVPRYIGQLPGWRSENGFGVANERLLGEEELKTLLHEGIADIGSHSVSHSPLDSTVLSADEIRLELEGSKQYLEERLGRPITLFALPYGVFDEQVLRFAKEAGYERVFLSIPLGSLTNIDGHVAGRIKVSPSDSPFSCWLKARGAYQFLPLTIAAKARLLKRARRIKA